MCHSCGPVNETDAKHFGKLKVFKAIPYEILAKILKMSRVNESINGCSAPCRQLHISS
jgi:hypothetical protein